MKFNLFIIILILGLYSCDKGKTGNEFLTKAEKTESIDKLKLDFSQPVLIDSSVYVMYPLMLDNEWETIGFESSYTAASYWNIIFYNTENGQYHLLSDNKKILIHSYDAKSSASARHNLGYRQVDKLIYYSISTDDFNKDGKLNGQDPNYLFTSDKTGKNFTQVSPEGMHVLAWQIIKNTDKILIQARKDSNKDGSFNNKDETVPLVYDLNTKGISEESFDESFKADLKKQLFEHWAQK